ncbi:MAG: rod shape-determining protein MreC [Candidatus Palauibacterales bacterium]|nr:rod shape-determining protein MreC [Candidatus Palauibacterales bacterium]
MRHLNVGRPENQRRDLVIVAVLLILSWSLSGLDSSQALGLTRLLRSTVLAPFLAADAAYERRAALAIRAADLEAERDELYVRLQAATDLERENRELRAYLSLPERVPGSFVIAELVPGRPSIGDSHTFLLRGAGLVGIQVPTGVSVPDGLVGVLRSVSGGSGFGEFWTHPDFRVSVRSATGGATGIARSFVGEGGERLMLVEGVPYQARMAEGAILETAGLGGVFPAGIRVGTVIAESDSRSGWSHSYLVEPAVQPGAVRAVTAWKRAPMESNGEDPGPAEVSGEAPGAGEEGTGGGL